MKDYIKQFYNEGLATTFYLKPIRFIDSKIKSNKIRKYIKIFIGILYTVCVLVFAWYMFLWRFPL